MREMILNHASLASAGRHEVATCLADLASGMGALVRDGVAPPMLRMVKPVYQIRCPGDRSLHEAYLELQQTGARDAYQFLARLVTKAPLLSDDVDRDARDRLPVCEATACETKTLPPEDGEPLVLCAISDGVAVGFPSKPIWDRDRVTIAFRELLPNGMFADADEEIDQLTRTVHAGPIADRHARRVRSQIKVPADVWSERAAAFPHLSFGADVEGQLGRLNPGWLTTVVNRLADLDASASAWQSTGGAAPSWTCKVTPESEKVMNNGKLREARRFRSVRGERLLFKWHARFGDSGRIHLRFDSGAQTVEVGYVGGHLPLPR